MGKLVLSFLMAMILLCSVYIITQEDGLEKAITGDEVSPISAPGDQRAGPASNMQSMRDSRNSKVFIPGNAPSFSAKDSMARQPGIVMQENMLDREELADFLKQNTPLRAGMSYFQEYVTPYDDAILSYLKEEGLDDKYSIYQAAVSWIWVSDTTLTGKQEAWLYPSQFLYDTPSYSTNPVSGAIVSDCSEQANTLASLLIASDEYDESTVRVAIGEVSLSGMSGGHAWVEVYEEGEWFPLDATVGPYYDDYEGGIVVTDSSETDYYYFRDEGYSVMGIWYYYNNEYFIDLGNHIGNAPDNWKSVSSSYY